MNPERIPFPSEYALDSEAPQLSLLAFVPPAFAAIRPVA
jgi:hypothetical protein